MRPLLAALVVIEFSGCGPAAAPELEDSIGAVTVAPQTVRDRLELDPTPFRVLPTHSAGQFTSRRVLADVSSTVPLALADGWLEAYAVSGPDGQKLAVTRFAGSLADVKFTEAQLPPNGLTLTRVSFALVEPAQLTVRWFGGGELGWAKGLITVDVRTWLLLSDGDESPLAVARLEFPVELTVSQSSRGVLGLSLEAARDGVLWNWAGLFELSDLAVSLEAFEVRSDDPVPPGAVVN